MLENDNTSVFFVNNYTVITRNNITFVDLIPLRVFKVRKLPDRIGVYLIPTNHSARFQASGCDFLIVNQVTISPSVSEDVLATKFDCSHCLFLLYPEGRTVGECIIIH